MKVSVSDWPQLAVVLSGFLEQPFDGTLNTGLDS